MEKRTVKFYSDLSIENSFLNADEYFSQHESIIFNDRREIEKSNKERFICNDCKQSLYIRGGIGTDKRILHFVHPSNDIICSQKTSQEFFTKSYILAKKFKECNESELHKQLKLFIAEQISTNTKEFSNIEVEKREYHDSKRKGYHIPDVKAKYKENRLAFELQLSTTFLHEIVKRETYYREKREMYLLWIFSILKEDIEDKDLLDSTLFQKFTTKDIFYSNYWNLFVIDSKAMLLSKEQNDLILRCFYKTGETFLSEYVSFSDLTFEEETKIIYYKKPTKTVKKTENSNNKFFDLFKTISFTSLKHWSFVIDFERELGNFNNKEILDFGLTITERCLSENKKLPITRFIEKYLSDEDENIFENSIKLILLLIDKRVFLVEEQIAEVQSPLKALLSITNYSKLGRVIRQFTQVDYQLKYRSNSRYSTDLDWINYILPNLKGYNFDNLFILKIAYINQLDSKECDILQENISTLKSFESIKQGSVIGSDFSNIIQVLHSDINRKNSCKLLIKEAYEANKDYLGLKHSDKIYSYKIDTEKEKELPVYQLFKKMYPSVFNPNHNQI